VDRNGKRRHKLTREDLEPLVMAGLTVTTIASKLGASEQSVRSWITRLGLPQPIEVRRTQVAAALRDGATSVIRTCRRHGETEFALVGSEKRPRCKHCRSEAVARRRRRVKEILVEEAGGQCVLCGYSRCLNALEFHHRDPTTKEFGVAMRGITRAIDAVRAEAAKCVLLCSNCHAEVEAGFTEVPPLELTGDRDSGT
jgi:5-methylcytosine-specific restriction endonuclease McrA